MSDQESYEVRGIWGDLFMARCAIAAYEDEVEKIKEFLDVRSGPLGSWKTIDIKAVNEENQFCFIAWSNQSGTLEIVVAFRGTDDFSYDWYKNNLQLSKVKPKWGGGNALKGKVHDGFSSAWLALEIPVKSVINSIIKENPNYEYVLFFTGHSLGGALSQLAVTDSFVGVKGKYVTTFSSPLVGDEEWQSNYAHQGITGGVYEARDEILGIVSLDRIFALNSVLKRLFDYEFSPLSYTINKFHGAISLHHAMATYVDYFTNLLLCSVEIPVSPDNTVPAPPPPPPIMVTDNPKEDLRRSRRIVPLLPSSDGIGIVLRPEDALENLRFTAFFAEVSTSATIYIEGIWAGRENPECLAQFSISAGVQSINESWKKEDLPASIKVGLLRYVRIRADFEVGAGSITLGSLLLYVNGVPVTILNEAASEFGLTVFQPEIGLVLNLPQYQIADLTTNSEGLDKVQVFRDIGTYRDGRDQPTSYYAQVNIVRYPADDDVYGAMVFGEAESTGVGEREKAAYSWSYTDGDYWSKRGNWKIEGRVYANGFGDKPTGRLYGVKVPSREAFFSRKVIVGIKFEIRNTDSSKVLSENNYGVVDANGLTKTVVAGFYNQSKSQYQSFIIYSLESPY
ncbi:hypothetical protein GCM10011348_20910 [Marinobacterium nitratireducens]|uniref:Fungal lipase-type domain-containing protein n=1 Tax=Marinobacterium nitratireducens TaxID=518897 RepID=A0A918DTF4_9GAMM|nr:lipase family protein [Marinobacterium nitratireducens]GGO81585.1 hypothetical protein GCM10011348_20910 [Marinobacterium nitratireducens]